MIPEPEEMVPELARILRGKRISAYRYDGLAGMLTQIVRFTPTAWDAELAIQELLWAWGCSNPLSCAAKIIDGPLFDYYRAVA